VPALGGHIGPPLRSQNALRPCISGDFAISPKSDRGFWGLIPICKMLTVVLIIAFLNKKALVLLLKFLSKLILILREGASPAQIAGGLTLGMSLGLMPLLNLYSFFILLLLLLLNVNLSIAIFSWTVFGLFSYLLDPIFHDIGYFFLVEVPSLRNFWTTLYNIPIIPFTHFNNTVVLGSFIVSLVLSIPLFLLARIGVIQYRTQLDTKIQKLKIVQMIKASKLYGLYDYISRING